jgi:CpeT/CpcT family (DUF1001)
MKATALLCLLSTIGGLALPLAMPSVARAQAPALSQKDVLEKDFRLLLEWFPGRYDNDLQVMFDKDTNQPAEARNGRIHSIFAPVSLPAFGAHVFYVEQYSDNNPEAIYRQRIYRFTRDDGENAARLEIFAPSPEQAARMKGAWRDPSKLAGLTPEGMTMYPGCEVWWRRQDNQFVGTMKKDACKVASRRSGRNLVITDDLVLTDHSIWIRDTAVDETGAYVYGNKAGVHHKLEKARPFRCWSFVLRGAKHGDSGVGNQNWQVFRDILIHDQGGTATIRTDETPAREFFLKMRNVEWPYGTNRPSLTLYVHQAGDDRAVSYSWADEGAQRVGLNLRWLQASCTLTPQDIFK